MFAVSFVIPCYNAEKFIKKNLTQLKKKIKSLNIVYQVILIDDGSRDKTYISLKNFIKNNKQFSVLKNKKNIGKSYSVLRGIKKSKFQNVIIIDCDLPYFESINKIIFFLKKNIDLVIINRKLKESKLVNKNLNSYQIIRYFLGWIIALINKKFLKLNIEGGDTQAGLKGFRKNKYLKKHKFISKKFFFDLELIHLYSQKKLKIVSVKTKFNVPKHSTIKILNIKSNFYIIKELAKILIFHKKTN